MDSVSWRSLMSLAGSIVMGRAIAKTGIAQKIALGVISMVGTQPILIMLGVSACKNVKLIITNS